MFSFHIEGSALNSSYLQLHKILFNKKDFSGAVRKVWDRGNFSGPLSTEGQGPGQKPSAKRRQMRTPLLPGLGEVFCQGDRVRHLIGPSQPPHQDSFPARRISRCGNGVWMTRWCTLVYHSALSSRQLSLGNFQKLWSWLFVAAGISQVPPAELF